MKYLTFIRHAESYRQSTPPAALMEAMGKFVEQSLCALLARRAEGDIFAPQPATQSVSIRAHR